MKKLLRSIRIYKILFLVLAFSFLLMPVLSNAKNLPDKYPKLANYYLNPDITDAQAEELAQWDLVIIGVEQQYKNPDMFEKMRKINKDIIILAYVPSEEIPEKYFDYSDHDYPQYKLYSKLYENDDWYLKNTSGEYLYFWPGHRMADVSSGWNKYLPRWMHDNVTGKYPNKWDGIYYDNCFNDISWLDNDIDMNQDGMADSGSSIDNKWKNGMKTMLRKSRALEGNSKFLVCNSDGSYYTYLNGRLIEAFPSEYDGNWTGAMKKYFDVIKEGKDPSVVIVNSTSNNGKQENYKSMRYTLASALLNDGFASFDKSMSEHSQTWWYDEYSVVLGNPLGGAYNINNGNSAELKNGMWRRDFEKGTVLLNSTDAEHKVYFNEGLEKINGTQDTEVNNGKVVGSVTVPKKDGLILLGRIETVAYVSFTNGAYAKVYNKKGKIKRNSFFTYDSSYNGGDEIVKLTDVNKTVIADETYVSVYKGNNLVAKFAPYGEGFKGGVNIAVNRLYGSKGKYYIVTGTKTYGPHVKIYDISGQAVSPGCFPYAENFRGGVYVAVGDVDKTNPGKEIVVSAGLDGGPHVRILNSKCELINPGFMAYDPGLRTGINVAIGDVDGDKKNEIITGTGYGAGPQVKVFNKNGKLENSFWAFNKDDRNGVKVSVADIDGDSKQEIIATSFGIFSY